MPETTPLDATGVDEASRKYGNELAPLITDLRSRRQVIEEQWLLSHAAWRGKHTRSFFNSELFKHNIPASRRSVERYVIRVAQMLIPSGEFFEVYPGDEIGTPAGKEAESVRAYMSFLLNKRIKVYPLVRQLVRTYGLYGRAIIKTGIDVNEVFMGKDPATRKEVILPMVWPTARAVDPFQFYVWPETATDLETQARVIVEDNMMPYETYKYHSDKGFCEPIDQKDLGTPEWPKHHTRRLQQSGINEPTATQSGQDDKGRKIIDYVALSEVWIKKGYRWEQMWLVWNLPKGPVVVRHFKQGYRPVAYRMAVSRQLPGEHYTSGMMDDLEPLQALLNDQWNMTLEGQATQFSPPAIVNPDLVSRPDTIVFRPRAKWLMDPSGAKWLETKDTTKFGYMGISTTMSLMDQFSGSSPMAEGTPMRNMPRAGFAVSSMMNLALSDIRDCATLIEDEILTPMMADLFRLTVLFVPPQQVMRIPGTQNFPAQRLQVEDLRGDWDFKWVGSLQSQDYQVRAQRLVATLGMLAKLGPEVLLDLEMRGKRINWEALLKRIWRDGLGERGADSIIEEISPQELAMRQIERALAAQTSSAGKPGGGGPGGLTTAQNPRSAEDVQRATSRNLSESSTATAGV